MDLGLQGRTALVLASTGGLGAATARAIGAEGANVVVTGRNADRAHRIAAELPSAVGVGCDLIEPGAADTLLAATRDAYGDPDIVVLNGPGPKPGKASQIDPATMQAAVDMLLAPQIAIVSQALGSMRERAWGRILSIGSSGVQQPIPALGTSNLGRAAMGSYLKTLSIEVASDGVTVNMLLPGRVATDRTAALDEAAAKSSGRTVEEAHAASVAQIPAGRYGDVAEFGAVAAFLCSAPASYVTGSQIRCDGGLVAHL